MAANQALTQANQELEARVAARTAELGALNARLRDSEERLRLAQRYAGAGSWDWDIKADRVAWSQEYLDLYGRDPKTVAPSHAAWLEAIHPDDREAAESALQDCLRRRDPDFRLELDHLGRPTAVIGVDHNDERVVRVVPDRGVVARAVERGKPDISRRQSSDDRVIVIGDVAPVRVVRVVRNTDP